MTSATILCSLIALALVAGASAFEPVEQDKTYIAAFQDVTCKSDVIAYPTTTAEVADQIATHVAAAKQAGVQLKIRASHKAFHSSSSFPCPGGKYSAYPEGPDSHPLLPTSDSTQSPANTTTVTLLLDNMTSVLKVNAQKHRIRVQSGMMITQLLQEVAKANMSLPLGAVPAFGDLTLGGVLVTGAHGSGHLATGSLGDIVLELTWVDGQGKVHVSDRGSTAGKALVAGLGIAGVVTEMLLQVQPPSNTQLSTRFKQSDAQLLQAVQEMLKESPHVLVIWRPDLHQYTAYVTKEVAASVPSTGGIINLDLPKLATQALGLSLAAWQADLRDLLPLAALPVKAAIQEMSVGHAMANDLKSKRRMFEGVGDTNMMQAASCGKSCLWHQGAKIAMDDIHMSIELEQLGDWISNVKKLVAADLHEHGAKKHRYLSPGYFWLRFGSGSQDFLSHTSNMTAPVHVQMSFMKSMINPLQPNKFGWILEVIEQFTLCKYKAKLHWGKNHQRDFTHPTCHAVDHLPFWDKAMAFRQGSDPGMIFEPALFTAMAAKLPNTLSQGCALRGECFCEQDEHCAPGFQCVPSLAFTEYKCCKPRSWLM
ncbi:hypothetical protein COO60DRAFT_690109 [Scenedesmus sp. NREL 46B-D3]|nr:hypothetical protein COO60DRAFT_690109 [Scenedesmus sp. NREL 46B-D3]